MHFRLPFVTVLFALSAFGASVKRDFAQVEQGIQHVETRTSILDTSIADFPNSGGTINQALAIHGSATQLSNTIQEATNDIDTGASFTNSESDTVTELTGNIQNTVGQTLTDLINKKPAISEIPMATQIVHTDLMTLSENANNFGKALVAKLSGPARVTVQQQIDTVNSLFQAALRAYGL